MFPTLPRNVLREYVRPEIPIRGALMNTDLLNPCAIVAGALFGVCIGELLNVHPEALA